MLKAAPSLDLSPIPALRFPIFSSQFSFSPPLAGTTWYVLLLTLFVLSRFIYSNFSFFSTTMEPWAENPYGPPSNFFQLDPTQLPASSSFFTKTMGASLPQGKWELAQAKSKKRGERGRGKKRKKREGGEKKRIGRGGERQLSWHTLVGRLRHHSTHPALCRHSGN